MSKSTDGLFAAALKAKETPETVVATTEASTEQPIEEPTDELEEAPVPAPTELDMLKSRARLMAIKFSNNISVEALKAKIAAKLEGDEEKAKDEAEAEAEADEEQDEEEVVQEEDEEEEVVEEEAPVRKASAPLSKKAKALSVRQKLYSEQMKLVRLRITNLNPAKKDLPGEIFTVANKILGAVRKFVPYGESTEGGYHVPYFIYQQLKEREFLNIKTRKDSRGRTLVETKMAREFALEVLPPLTERELAQLAAAQAAAAGME